VTRSASCAWAALLLLAALELPGLQAAETPNPTPAPAPTPAQPAGDAPAPAPTPALLDDAALTARVDAVFSQLRTLHINLGSTVDPDRIKDQLEALRSAIAQAAHPNGEAALQGA